MTGVGSAATLQVKDHEKVMEAREGLRVVRARDSPVIGQQVQKGAGGCRGFPRLAEVPSDYR